MSKNRHREDRAAERREPPLSEARTGIGLFRLGGIAFVITFALMSLVMSSDSIRGSLAIGAHADGDGVADHLDRGLIYLEQGYVSFSCAARLDKGNTGLRAAKFRDGIVGIVGPGIAENAAHAVQKCVEAFDAGHHAQAGGDLPTFLRLGWVTRIFFAPGDIVVIGIMDIASELSLDSIRAAVQTLLGIFGDILIGAISLTVWLAALLLIMLVIKPFTGVMFRGQGAETAHGVQKERKEFIPGRGGPESPGR